MIRGEKLTEGGLERDAGGKHTESEVTVDGLDKKAVSELCMLSVLLSLTIWDSLGQRTHCQPPKNKDPQEYHRSPESRLVGNEAP